VRDRQAEGQNDREPDPSHGHLGGAVVRTFLRGITINKKAGQATLTWFRLPTLQNVGLRM
jgi:hypothetical protein